MSFDSSEQCDIVSVYSADEEWSRNQCAPFLQNIAFAGPKGETVRTTALFNEGAMISAMCTSLFNRIKHRLGNWTKSSKRLRMANSVIVPSHAVWRGEVEIAGIKAEGEFEVFDSGGGWKFLFGKPMLHAFKAVHDYSTDQVQITGKGGTKTISNQSHVKSATIESVEEDERDIGYVKQETPEEVPFCNKHDTTKCTDQFISTEETIPICILSEDGALEQEVICSIVDAIPTNFLQDDKAIFTRVSDPRNPKRIAYIVKAVQYGNTLTEDERRQAEALVARYTDIFAGSLSEVLQVPGAQHRLQIPDGATFNLRVHQRALTPPQAQFLHGRIDEMLEAGIIERAPPEAVKCCATTVLAQKAHEQGGLTIDKLKYRINEQCAQEGQPPAFVLPEHEVTNEPREQKAAGPQKWRICQNFNEVNRHTVIAPMPQGDIQAKQQ